MAERSGQFDARRMPGFGATAGFAFVLLYAPLAVLVAYSFNAGSSVALWEGWSLRWYAAALANDAAQDAALRSLWLALLASAGATACAVLAALATARGRAFRGRTAIYALINLPLIVPEIVTGVALLIVFAAIKVATGYQGLLYLIAAHTAFCIPFAYLPIRACLQSMDPMLERAAADLYATPLRTFRHVTLPLIAPGILAGATLAFVISLDDVVISEFVKSAGQETLPTYLLGQVRRGLTPEMNALSTMLLALSVAAVSVSFFLTRKTS